MRLYNNLILPISSMDIMPCLTCCALDSTQTCPKYRFQNSLANLRNTKIDAISINQSRTV
jgi:hypothetical protein